jgi:hypothetical protein
MGNNIKMYLKGLECEVVDFLSASGWGAVAVCYKNGNEIWGNWREIS